MENWGGILWEGISGTDMNRKVVRDQIIDLKTIHHVYIILYQVYSKGSLKFFIIKQHDPFIMNNFGNIIFYFTFL